MMPTMPTLSPASEKLLREIAKRDAGHGVVFKWCGRGRYNIPGTGYACNQRSFYPLTGAGLVTEDHEDAPVRITDAGRRVLAELDKQRAEKKPRPRPSAGGQTALRLLREIAKHDEPVLIYSDGRRRIWNLGAHDGYRASIDTWLALQRAGYIHIEYGFAGGRRVSVTDAGRAHLAGGPK